MAYQHQPHPHVAARRDTGPVKVADQPASIHNRIALRITGAVGTMWAAYAFVALALLALPNVLGLAWLPARTLLIVGWVSQTLIQLVMLAVLQLGQNILGAAADRRAEMTYLDAEAILHEVREIHHHLDDQDASRLPATLRRRATKR